MRSKLVKLSLNEMTKLKRFKAENKGRYVDEDSFFRILSYAPSAAYELAYLLMYETGIRPHELLSLTVEHVEERKDNLVLVNIPDENPETPSGRNKTGGRTIVIHENAKQLLKLQKRIKNTVSTEFQSRARRLFPFKHGIFSIMFTRMKRKQRKESTNPERNFKGRLYDLRHSAITNLYLKGLTDQEVRKLVGWTPSSKMPDVYVHVHINHIINSYYKNDALTVRIST